MQFLCLQIKHKNEMANYKDYYIVVAVNKDSFETVYHGVYDNYEEAKARTRSWK